MATGIFVCYDLCDLSRRASLASPTPHSALLGLPLLAWARRFKSGQARLEGRLVAPVRLGAALLVPGPVVLEVEFRGGPEPELLRAVVIARQPRAGGVVRLPVSVKQAEELVAALWDLHVEAAAWAVGEVHVRFGPAMEVAFPGGQVRIRGAACGPPDSLVLAGPLEIQAGNATVRLAGDQRLRWLSSLAKVRVDRAVLHPDGRVALEGGARRGLDLAVRKGLSRASEAVSRLVRHSPRFRVVRDFLPA